ncbi:hypothetical protein [Brachyspira catarrhinii]|uniref:Dynamin family protein n=1 Tax=Brachyspira catarrhinii TaxID=2528966 RepID=A0ABY2TSG3_9SPIR|nr:hypothetical protein [Brachyspira catarrhinii]TKZ35826.1 hypothetical protein EZH24_03270 [Brachyspira catarrhinii]
MNCNNIWIGNKFFEPSYNLVQSTYDILNDTLELNEQIKKAYSVDGKIIGTGESDFTKSYVKYELNYNDKPFILIDLPGIEGQESKYEKIIKEALAKAHAIVYVNGTNKAPESGTIKKIKSYLRDNCLVYSIYNVKGKADSYEFEEDRISLGNTHKDTNVVLNETDKKLSKVFDNDTYKKCIMVQGLLSFSSLANINSKISTIIPSRNKDLLKAQKSYFEYFQDYNSMRKFSQIDDMALIIKNKVNTFEEDIIKSNIKKVLVRVNDILETLKNEKEKYSKIVEDSKKETEDFKKSINDYIESFDNNYSNKSKNLYNKFFQDVLGKMFSEIETMGRIVGKNDRIRIENEIKEYVDNRKIELENDIKEKSDKLINELIDNIKNRLERFKTDLRKIEELYNFDNISDLKIDMSLDIAFSEMDIKFKEVGGILLGIVIGILGIVLFPLSLPVLISGIVSLVLDLLLNIVSLFNPNRRREKAKRKSEEELDEIKKENMLKMENKVKEVINKIKYTANELNKNIDNIYNKQVTIFNLLSNKIEKLEILEKELKEI